VPDTPLVRIISEAVRTIRSRIEVGLGGPCPASVVMTSDIIGEVSKEAKCRRVKLTPMDFLLI
jgi:hypothetical protein